MKQSVLEKFMVKPPQKKEGKKFSFVKSAREHMGRTGGEIEDFAINLDKYLYGKQ